MSGASELCFPHVKSLILSVGVNDILHSHDHPNIVLTHRIRRNLSSSFMKINSVGIGKRKKIIFSEKKLKTANWQTAFVIWFFVVYAHICWYKQMLLNFLESCYREKVHIFFRLKLS